jgi:hypothetical protein
MLPPTLLGPLVAYWRHPAYLPRNSFVCKPLSAQTSFRDAVVMCNTVAMAHLARGDAPACAALLSRAMQMLRSASIDSSSTSSSHAALKILTYNSAACMHRRERASAESLRCLQRALAVSAATQCTEGIVVTHLNMCAVLSQLGRHNLALEHAQVTWLLSYSKTTYCVVSGCFITRN